MRSMRAHFFNFMENSCPFELQARLMLTERNNGITPCEEEVCAFARYLESRENARVALEKATLQGQITVLLISRQRYPHPDN